MTNSTSSSSASLDKFCHLSILASTSGGLGLGGHPQPQFHVADEAQSIPNTGDGGLSDAQISAGLKKDVSSLEAVGHRYALDGIIKQMTFVSDKHFSYLDDYLEHLRAKLTQTFLDMIDDETRDQLLGGGVSAVHPAQQGSW